MTRSPAPRLTILPKETYRRSTWKNGLGYTDEIAIYPEGAQLKRGDFLWRLSSARIEQPSPFSLFPDHDRFLVVLRGEGVRLTHAFDEESEETVDVPRQSPYEFPGDVPSRCELPQGPITDLSVFIRKAEAHASVEVIQIGPNEPYHWVPAGRWNFLFALEASLQITSPLLDSPLGISEGDTLRVELSEPLPEEHALEIRSLGKTEARPVLISIQGGE